MKRIRLLASALLAVAFLLVSAPVAPAAPLQGFVQPFGQSSAKARASLFSRVEGGRVRVAIEIVISPGWHLYHAELGHPDAVGLPTTIELHGQGIEWGELSFPEPHRLEQPDWNAFILSHEGKIVVRAEGQLAEGADGSDVGATLKGLTCEDDGLCVPYEETVRSRGVGKDELFAGFPAEAPPRLEDEHRGGKANASLYSRVSGRDVRLAIEIEIQPHWHLYHSELGHPEAIGKPTRVTIDGEGVSWGEVRFPEPKKLDQSDLGAGAWIWAHDGTIVLHADGMLEPGVDEPGPLRVKLDGLTCEDDGLCVPYSETLVDRGRGADALFVEAPSGDAGGVASSGAWSAIAPEEDEDDDLGAFLGLAVFWGLFTLLMPCTYPMIPITISFFTKQAADRKGSALPLSLAYGLGIIAIFVLIGVAFGSVIIPFATHPVTNIVIGALFLYFALVLFGVVNLQPPRVLLEFAGKASRTGGYLGVFLMGATLVVTSFTCTAPFVGSLLSFGAQGGDVGRIALGMAVFGLTMAVPFVALSLLPGYMQSIPRSGEWMNSLKVFLGFVELAAAFKFISNSDLVWKWEFLSRELFLAIWVVIFLASALFLLGWLPGKRATPGPLRAVAGILMLAFTGYCAWGMTGKPLDPVMTAIVPNYSGGKLMPQWVDFGAETILVVDDYDAALATARSENRALLVNFTGHT